jgi:hypothetical protein
MVTRYACKLISVLLLGIKRLLIMISVSQYQAYDIGHVIGYLEEASILLEDI